MLHGPRQPARRRDQPVPPAARAQSRRLVSLGRRGVRPRPRGGQADPPLDRLLGLSLVPRHGARVVRERGHRGAHERPVRQHQGRSRGTPGRRRRLHAGGAAHDRPRRLAAHGVPDARRAALPRRHLLPARRSARHAGVSARARGGVARVPRPAGRRGQGGRRSWYPACSGPRRPRRPTSRSIRRCRGGQPKACCVTSTRCTAASAAHPSFPTPAPSSSSSGNGA